jgi:glyoxylate reductase
MRPAVFVTRRIPEPGLDLLRTVCDVDVSEEDRVLTREEIIEGVRGKDALLCLLTDDIDAAVLDASPGLKVVANYAVGYNNIDVDAATQRKIPVTNTPGVLTETTADFAWALLMCTARRVVESDKFTRAGLFRGWAPMLLLGCDVFAKTLGIVGFGRIGEAVARRASGFSMEVLYYDDRRRDPEEEGRLGVRYATFDELLRRSDFISIHVPLLESTRHLFGASEFRAMKNTAILINTARGPVVDERALVDALRAREIAGAGLDVYEAEPALEPGLIELDNVVLAPHIASASVETRTKMAIMAAENVLAALRGEVPPNIVNREVFL